MSVYTGSQAAKFAALGVTCLILGGLLFGNVFTFITGEYGGVGPGFGQTIGFKVDTTTIINTANPENYMYGMARVLAPLTTVVWQLTGKMWAEPDGTWSIFWSRHAGVLLNDGKDFVEQQVSGDSSATEATFIALSNDATVPAAGWSRIWSEINTGGTLDRTNGTYASTGVGTYTIEHQFTADGAYTDVQLTGLCWSDTDASNDTTLCADTFTPVTLANNDKITVTWTITIS